MTQTTSRLALCAILSAVFTACGGPDTTSTDQTSTGGADAQSATFTGGLTVSTTSTTVGTPFTVTETAVNLTDAQVGPVIVGIRRLGLTVLAARKPSTGICRIAGSASCNFLELAPFETQAYTLTLVASAPGSYQLQGWTTSSYLPGGYSGTVTITVR